jgi:hypothetical protein
VSTTYTVVQVFDVLFSLAVGLCAALEWPWDFHGRRRVVTLKRERQPWE